MIALILSLVLCLPLDEILANGRLPPGFKPVFSIGAIDPLLLERMRQSTWHPGCPVPPEDLRQLQVAYWSFGREPSKGILIVHRDVAQEVMNIFRDLFEHGFMIERMVPIEEYNGDDNASMAANNTSAFNCRDVTGQPGKFSNHSWGRAIDINPLTNPYVKGRTVLPPEGRRHLDREVAEPGSVLSGSFIVERFAKAGWQWGGSWADLKDYQHFEKPVP